MEPIRKAYTKSLRKLRAEKNYTQEALAEELNCDYTTYGKIEKGTIVLTIERAIKLAVLYGVSLEELLNFEELVKDPEFNSLKRSEKNHLMVEEPQPTYVNRKSIEQGLHFHVSIGDTSKNDPKANEFMDNLTALVKSLEPEK